MQLWLAAPRHDNDVRFPLPPDFGREVWTAEEGLARYQVKLPQPVIARYVKLGFPPEQIAFLHLAKVRMLGTSSSKASLSAGVDALARRDEGKQVAK